MLKKGSDHAPPHLQLDDTPYFLTGAIYRKRPLLRSAELKGHLLDLIRQSFADYTWELHDWVILDNHYHLLGLSRRGQDLASVMGRIHRRSSDFIRAATNCEPPVWWNYWDYCPRDEKDYRIRQNYLYNNPIKHGYVNDLNDWPYSSFPRMLAEQGRDAAARQFREYHEYRNVAMDGDDF